MKTIRCFNHSRLVVSTPLCAILACIAVTILWRSAGADDSNPGSLPAFEAVFFDELHARFVRPEGWRVAFQKGKLMGSLVLEERSGNAETLSARFTVNPVSKLMRVRFRRVSEQIDAFDAAFTMTSNPRRLEGSAIQIGGYVGRDLLLRTERPDGTVTVERRLYLAHDARDWLVVVRFEAPEARWNELDPIRETMFRHIDMR